MIKIHLMKLVIISKAMLQFPLPGIRGNFTGAWCNGSTAVFGTVDSGSNPGAPA